MYIHVDSNVYNFVIESRVFFCVVPNVYSFPVFRVEFCNLLLQELDHFEESNMPKGRPNSMNNYGVSL